MITVPDIRWRRCDIKSISLLPNVLGKQAADLCTSTLTQYFVREYFAERRWQRYVDDLVDGILAMLDSAEPGPVNLGSEHELTMRELAETIVELTGSRSTISYLPRPTDDPELRRPDLTRARELLDFAPAVSPADGLRRTIEWFADHTATPSPA